MIVAVYTLAPANCASDGDQVTEAVYSAVAVAVVTGVASVAGTVTPDIAVPAIVAAVTGNMAVTTPESAGFVAVAPATVNWFAVTPVNVNPNLGVRVMVAV